jgi:hypothetical protein
MPVRKTSWPQIEMGFKQFLCDLFNIHSFLQKFVDVRRLEERLNPLIAIVSLSISGRRAKSLRRKPFNTIGRQQ